MSQNNQNNQNNSGSDTTLKSKQLSVARLNARVEKFRYHEIFAPELITKVPVYTNVDYFPRGNDGYMYDLVEVFKGYIRNKVQQVSV